MNRLLIGIADANSYLLKESDTSDALQLCITALGRNIAIDRCYIFKNEINNDGILILNYDYEWCNEGIEPYIGSPDLSGHTYDTFPGLYETLIQNLPLYGNVKDIYNEFFKEVMEMQGIKSYLFTPIFLNTVFWGWIGFDDCKSEREWKIEEVRALHTVAINIGIRLNHDKTRLELENTVNKLDFYLKSSNQGKWEWDLITNEVEFTYNWFGMLGYQPDELEHSFETWRTRVHPDDIEKVVQKLNAYITKKSDNYSGVVRLLHKSGHYVWVKYSGIMVTDNLGNPIRIVGSHIDISEIKEKEFELAQQRNEYDHLVNNLDEIIFKTDLDGKIIFLNNQWEKITGHTNNKCLNTTIFNYFSNLPEKENILLNLNESKKFEVELIKKNKTKIWVLLILNIQIDLRNNKKIFIGSITDINDTIKLKNKLKISEQKFRFIAENTSDIIMQHLNDGTITYISSNCLKILGYKESELLNKDPYSFIHPDDIERVLIQHNNIIDFKTEIITFRFRKKEGTYIWLETYSKVIVDSNEKVIGIQTSSRDITERIKDQEEIKQALEKERELNELKTNFVSITSHQFRTPLTVIYSNVELLNHKVSKTNSSLKNDIEVVSNRITTEVERMTELMNNILVFGKYESNNLKIEIKEITLTNFIERLIETYFNNEKDGRKVSFEKIGLEKKIESDESLLTHILTNLISNAFKYSKDCPNPIIRITYFENNFKIEIIDFGIGIPIIETKHLFQSFFRGSNTSSIKGSGLGLIIAKQFSELLNGTISISSEENKGTIVTIVFPYGQNQNFIS